MIKHTKESKLALSVKVRDEELTRINTEIFLNKLLGIPLRNYGELEQGFIKKKQPYFNTNSQFKITII